MYRIWACLASFFYKLASKSSRGRAISSKYHNSARDAAFYHFNQGLRPSELPDLGVKKETLYRYYQSWKRRHIESSWRLAIRLLKTSPQAKAKLAEVWGVPESEIDMALKHCRSTTQLKKRLGIDTGEKLEDLIGEFNRLQLDGIIGKLRKCESPGHMLSELEAAARRMEMGKGEFMVLLIRHIQKLKEERSLGVLKTRLQQLMTLRGARKPPPGIKQIANNVTIEAGNDCDTGEIEKVPMEP
ncbi:hypothetical protein ACFLX4_01210 [Chloroflexota bacterium]